MGGLFDAYNWQKIWNFHNVFLRGLGTTLVTALFAILLALVIGIVFGLMATSGKKALKAVTRVYVGFFQNTPILLQVCFLFYALAFSGHSIGIIRTGIVALGLYHGAYVTEVFRSGIEAVSKG